MMQKTDDHTEKIKSHDILPTSKDVLCGRGKTHFFHEGNAKFREIVGVNLGTYLNATSRSEKSAIVRTIADEVLRQGARFLLRKKGDGMRWYDGGVVTARAKVRVCVCDCVNEPVTRFCSSCDYVSYISMVLCKSSQVGHALRDASSSKSQSIMNIHLQHARSKSNGVRRPSPADVVSGLVLSDALNEEQTHCALENDNGWGQEESSHNELDSFCLDMDFQDVECQEDSFNNELSTEWTFSGVDCRYEELSDYTPLPFQTASAGTSIAQLPPIRPFVEASNSMDDEAVDLYLAHSFRHPHA